MGRVLFGGCFIGVPAGRALSEDAPLEACSVRTASPESFLFKAP